MSEQATATDGDDQKGRPEREMPQWLTDYGTWFMPTLVGLGALALTLTAPRLAFFAVVGWLMLVPSILVHEWGHYRSARKSGMGVSEFNIGFGKVLWSRVDKNGVLWSLKAIPVGGSVEVKGMTIEDVEQRQVPPGEAFIHATPWRRLKLVYAGVAMNLLCAWIALVPMAVMLRPADLGWKGVLVAPLAAALSMGVFFAMALRGLVQAVTQWDADVGSILRMPQMLESGVDAAATTGMSAWTYMLLAFALVNLSIVVLNALPLYPLDGYHGILALADSVRGKIARMRGRGPVSPWTAAQMAPARKVTGSLVAVFAVSVVGRDVLSFLAR